MPKLEKSVDSLAIQTGHDAAAVCRALGVGTATWAGQSVVPSQKVLAPGFEISVTRDTKPM
ncbi:MAG: hypothetical protein DSY87_06170 [Methylococcus sp.]|nr:MAG: hypothetical protein DSY87_06170 [Methylococcus sp.]